MANFKSLLDELPIKLEDFIKMSKEELTDFGSKLESGDSIYRSTNFSALVFKNKNENQWFIDISDKNYNTVQYMSSTGNWFNLHRTKASFCLAANGNKIKYEIKNKSTTEEIYIKYINKLFKCEICEFHFPEGDSTRNIFKEGTKEYKYCFGCHYSTTKKMDSNNGYNTILKRQIKGVRND